MMPARARSLAVVWGILILECLSALVLLAGGVGLHFSRLPFLLDKLRYATLLGLAVLILMTWYYGYLMLKETAGPARFRSEAAGRIFSGARGWFWIALAVGLLPAVFGFLRRPQKVQIPQLAPIGQILSQLKLLISDGWPRVFGLGPNPFAWLLQAFLLAALASCVWQRRRVWRCLLRFNAVELSLVDVLAVALVFNLIAFVLGDLTSASPASYRYLATVPLLLAAIASLFVAGLRPAMRAPVAAIVMVLLIANQWGNLRVSAAELAGRTHSQRNSLGQDSDADRLLQACDDSNVRHIFADYWSAYRLTFLARERVIVAPLTGKNRYPDYVRQVADDPAHGYLSTESDTLIRGFRSLQGYTERVVGSYHLFTFDSSRAGP